MHAPSLRAIRQLKTLGYLALKGSPPRPDLCAYDLQAGVRRHTDKHIVDQRTHDPHIVVHGH